MSDTTHTTRRWWPVVILVGGLTAYDVVRSAALPDRWHPWANAALGIAVLLFGRSVGLGWAAMGLARRHAPAGIRLGLVAFGAVAGALVVAALVPTTRGFFEDEELTIGFGEMVLDAVVRIPLATVLPEELAFRGVLLGLLLGLTSTRSAVVLSSVAFGLWHVPPLVGTDGTLAILGTVAVTFVAGVAFALLRLRSGSLWAPVLAHIATNSTALVIAWAVAT